MPSYSATVSQAWQSNCCTFLALCLTLLTFSGCGFGGAQADEQPEPFQIRKPQATFTPTPLGADGGADGDADTAIQSATGQDGQQSNTGSGQIGSSGDGNASTANNATNTEESSLGESNGSESNDGAERTDSGTIADPNFAGSQAVITFSLVNGRGGPGTNFDIVGIVAEGEVFDVLGQNEAGDWWQLCCYLGEEFWAIDDFVEIRGGGNVVAQAPAAPTVAPAPAQPTATPVPPEAEAPAQDPPEAGANDLGFDLVIQEQFSEQSVIRAFLYVYSDQVQALEGYSLKVTKDGTDLPVGNKSYGPQAGYTWPVATARQRFENMKVEFPGESPAGTWVLQLVDSGGKLVGPPATFNLSGNEPEQELYVRYKQK